MKKEEISVYKEIKKNTEMAISAIDFISDKIYDDSLSLQISREALKYSDIKNKAENKLIQGKAEVYKTKPLAELMLKAGILMNTMFNTSTGHIAELMIQGSSRGIVDIQKIINKYPGLNGHAMETAKELMDFEEKNIERLKKYL